MTNMNFVSAELGRTLDHMRATLLHELYGAAGTDEPWVSEPATIILQKYLSFRNAEKESLESQIEQLTREKTEIAGKRAAEFITRNARDEIVSGALDEMLHILQVEGEIENTIDAKLEVVVAELREGVAKGHAVADNLEAGSSDETKAALLLDSFLDLLKVDQSIGVDSPVRDKGKGIIQAIEKLQKNLNGIERASHGMRDFHEILDRQLHVLQIDPYGKTIDDKADVVIKKLQKDREDLSLYASNLYIHAYGSAAEHVDLSPIEKLESISKAFGADIVTFTEPGTLKGVREALNEIVHHAGGHIRNAEDLVTLAGRAKDLVSREDGEKKSESVGTFEAEADELSTMTTEEVGHILKVGKPEWMLSEEGVQEMADLMQSLLDVYLQLLGHNEEVNPSISAKGQAVADAIKAHLQTTLVMQNELHACAEHATTLYLEVFGRSANLPASEKLKMIIDSHMTGEKDHLHKVPAVNSIETVEGLLDLILRTLNVDGLECVSINSKREMVVKTIRAMRANEAAMREELFDLNRIAAIEDIHTYFDDLIQALQIEGDIYPSVEKKKEALTRHVFNQIGDMNAHKGFTNDIVISIYGRENDISEDSTTSQKLAKIRNDFCKGQKRVLDSDDIHKVSNSLAAILKRAGGDVLNTTGKMVDLASYTERFVFNTLTDEVVGDAGDSEDRTDEESVIPTDILRTVYANLEEIIRIHGEDTHPDEPTSRLAERALNLVRDAKSLADSDMADIRRYLTGIVEKCGGEVDPDESTPNLAQSAHILVYKTKGLSEGKLSDRDYNILRININNIYARAYGIDSLKSDMPPLGTIEKLSQELEAGNLKFTNLADEIDIRSCLERIVRQCDGTIDAEANLVSLAAYAMRLVWRMNRDENRKPSVLKDGSERDGLSENLDYSEGFSKVEDIRKRMMKILEAGGQSVGEGESINGIARRVEALVSNLMGITPPKLEVIENGLKKIILDAGGAVEGDESLTKLAARVQTLVEKTR